MKVWLVLSAAGVAGMTITAIEDAKFAPVNPRRPQGAQMAVLWGCAMGRAAGRTAGRSREELLF